MSLLTQAVRIHPALHVSHDGVLVGIVDETSEYRLISSERKIYSPDSLKESLLFAPRSYADLAGRWPGEDWNRFLDDGEAPGFSEVLALIIRVLDEAMEFPRAEHRALVAVWTMATYFFPLFLTFPRLSLAGERESGKSKLLLILRATAWNALLMLNPTPAVLFRLVHEFRPTLLLDEMEGVSKEDAREVLAIINAGYKAGGTVPRCEGDRTKHVELFEVYSPLALAAIKAVNPTTEDRCIPLSLQRGTHPDCLNKEVDLNDPTFAGIRAACYRLLMTRWREVRESYQTLVLPPWLNARARELWKPLLAVAAVADRENGLTLTPDLETLAQEHVKDRAGISSEGEGLLTLLVDRLGEAEKMIVRPRDLREPLRECLGWRDAPSSELVGVWLRRFFRRGGKDREGAKYEVSREQLSDLSTRYGLIEKADV